MAECPDELAFRKGDILTVIDQNIAGTCGWWLCSLHGRHGLAPANRLRLLPQTGTAASSITHVTETSKITHAKPENSVQNIYQIPSVTRHTSSSAYVCMDLIYKVPFTPLSASKYPALSGLKHSVEGLEDNKVQFVCVCLYYKKLYVDAMIVVYCSEVKVDVPSREVLTLMIREVAEMQFCETPAGKKSLQMGTGGLSMGTGMQQPGSLWACKRQTDADFRHF